MQTANFINTGGSNTNTGSIVPATPASPIVPAKVNPPITPNIPPVVPQSIIDNAKANPSVTSPTGTDVFGNKVSAPVAQTNTSGSYVGVDGKTYDSSGKLVQPSSDTSSSPSPTTDGTLADQADRDALAQTQAEYQIEAQNIQNAITNIQNGVTPLTDGEQAQIAGLQQQFQVLVDQQNLQNTGAVGTAQVRGYQTGAGEYDPLFQAKTIGSIASAGAAKVADLQIKEASAVAALTQSFKDNDINAIKDAYAIYQDASKARQDALQKTITDTQDAITAAQTEADKVKQYNLDVEKFNQTKDQAAFDNALKTEQETFDEKYKTDTLNLDKFKAGEGAGGGSNGVSQAAQIGPDGNADPVTQKAVLDQITAKYGPMTAQAIQGLTNYTINPADWSSRAGTKGLSRADAVSLAQMYDPTYTDTSYAIRAAYLKSISSTQSGTVGSSVNAANKAVNHLTAFVNSMQQLPYKSPFRTINAIDNAMTADPKTRQTLAAANTEGLGVAEELAKFFKGSGTVDVASIDAWKNQLSTNASPGDVKGLTQGAITLLAGQLETLAEQYQSTMGKAPETDFLNTSARASLSNLKNQGFDVNIPGINYTDKDAYIKNDPEAQANMSAAVTALTNAGLPITPENILQAAQSM